MTFSNSARPGNILFESWNPQTDGQYFGALLAVACIGALHQLLVAVRARHFRWALQQRLQAPKQYNALLHRAVNGALFVPVIAVAYLAMLAAMSAWCAALRLRRRLTPAPAAAYNVGIFIAVCVGEGAGVVAFSSHLPATAEAASRPASVNGPDSASYKQLQGSSPPSLTDPAEQDAEAPGLSEEDKQVMSLQTSACCE